MSVLGDLLDRPATPAPDGATSRTPVLAGLLAAGRAASISLVGVFVPVVAAWALSSSTRADWLQTLRVTLDVWLLAHRTGIVVPGGHIGITPLALMVAVLALCVSGGRRLSRTLDPKGEAIRAGLSRAEPTGAPLRALVAFTGGYATLAGILSLLASGSQTRPTSAQAVLGAAVVAALGVTLGAAVYRREGSLRDGVASLLERLPRAVARCVRLGALAVGAQLAVGLVLVLVALVLGLGRVAELHSALAPGVAGGIVLTLGQLAFLPNAVVWAAAYVAGPGFAVGAGTSVTTSGVTLGAVPAVPMLGLLPENGGPAWLELLIVLPVLIGVPIGLRLLRQGDPLSRLLAGCAGSALVAGAGSALLAWLSGGPMGPGRLGVAGPVPWEAGLWFGVEVLIGAVVVAGSGHFLRHEEVA